MSPGHVLVFLLFLVLATASVWGTEQVTVFPGSGPADLSRPLPADAFKARIYPERESLESYSAWNQFDDGSTMIVSVLITNLDRPHRSAIAVQYFGTDGKNLTGQQEFPGEALISTETRTQFGRNSFERLPDGRYRLRVATPLNEGGNFTADFMYTPNLAPFHRGDGRVYYGNQKRRFELMVLFPRSQVTGHYTVNGRVVDVKGQGYGDHVAQNIWPHQVANNWFNYRFFSPDAFVASTSWLTPPKYGSKLLNQTYVADRDRPLFVTGDQQLKLERTSIDPVSGYPIPREIHAVMAGNGYKLELTPSLPGWVIRDDLLKNVNPILRTLVRVFISRPYTYWFRAPTTAVLTRPDGSSSRVQGTFIGELIYVNE